MSAPGKAKSEVNSSWLGEDLDQTSTEDRTPIPGIPVVRTLKDPPEIWELVQPVPPTRSTPGRAFIGHLTSMRSVVTLLIVAIAFGGIYFGLRSGIRMPQLRNTQVVPARQVEKTKTGVADSSKPTVEHDTAAPEVTSNVVEPTDVPESEYLPRKASRRSTRPVPAVTQVDNPPVTGTTPASKTDSVVQTAPVSQTADQKIATQPSTKLPETIKVDRSDSASAKSKSKTTLNPQLIGSPTTSTPSKPKVINWP